MYRRAQRVHIEGCDYYSIALALMLELSELWPAPKPIPGLELGQSEVALQESYAGHC